MTPGACRQAARARAGVAWSLLSGEPVSPARVGFTVNVVGRLPGVAFRWRLVRVFGEQEESYA
jgi:hypothetical protein